MPIYGSILHEAIPSPVANEPCVAALLVGTLGISLPLSFFFRTEWRSLEEKAFGGKGDYFSSLLSYLEVLFYFFGRRRCLLSSVQWVQAGGFYAFSTTV